MWMLSVIVAVVFMLLALFHKNGDIGFYLKVVWMGIAFMWLFSLMME